MACSKNQNNKTNKTFSGLALACATSVIGSAEVLEANIQSGLIT